MIKQQFGPYVLFKKLGHDPLGETFRAGRVQGNSVGQVVLLRVYNGTAIAQQAIEAALRERHDLTRHVRGPQIAPGIDHGRLDGVPYSAYEYSSSQDLRTITDLARKRGQPVPKEQAVAILERLAQGLRAASESDYKGQGVLHGYLVPELVQISTEGEVRLLGFEVGEALRRGAADGTVDPEHQRFLPPEATSGAEIDAADDVYSLGVLLLELMTNTRAVDAQSRDELLTRLDATQGEIANLIRKSLAPSKERIRSVSEWHDQIGEVVPQSGPSTFQLAFYLHNLLKDEIAKEARERRDESDVAIPIQVAAETAAMPLPAPPSPLLTDSGPQPAQPPETSKAPPTEPTSPAPPPAAPTPAAPLSSSSARSSESTEVLETDAVLDQVLRESPEPLPVPEAAPSVKSASTGGSGRSGRRMGPLLAAAALVTTAVAAGAFYGPDLLQRATAEDADPEQIAATTMPADLAVERPSPLEPSATDGSEPNSSEQLAAATAAAEEQAVLQQIDRLVTERAARLEQSLRSEYDKEIELLRQQLDETRKNAAQRAEEAKASAAAAPPEAPSDSVEEDATDAVSSTPISLEDTPRRESADVDPTETAKVVDRVASAPAPSRRTSPADPRTRETLGTAPNEVDAASNEPQPETETETFVEPVVVPPNLVKPATPRYPPVAQRLSKEAVVELRVFVERDGSVSQVRPIGKHGFGFDEAAARAARSAVFEPGTRDGTAVSAWTTMRVRFQLK